MARADEARDEYLKHQVAVACRIIALHGYADLTLGHVSIRDPERGLVFIKRKGPGLHEIEPHDVLVHELNDDAALKTTTNMHYEAVLHTETYKSRSDVNAVIHSHPPYSTALGATDSELKLLSHDAVLFADGLAVYEDTFELITEPDQGRAVADTLDMRRALLLRNHGNVVVGKDIRWAVLAAVTLERAIKIQMIAERLGSTRSIGAQEARAFMATKYPDSAVREYWDAWQRSVRAAGTQVQRQVSFD